jgi:hypothetical protein
MAHRNAGITSTSTAQYPEQTWTKQGRLTHDVSREEGCWSYDGKLTFLTRLDKTSLVCFNVQYSTAPFLEEGGPSSRAQIGSDTPGGGRREGEKERARHSLER